MGHRGPWVFKTYFRYSGVDDEDQKNFQVYLKSLRNPGIHNA